jgi:excinuclease ABC subunit A
MKAQKWIQITGARQHNLKNLNVRFPKGAFSVVTGPSGSGKSSLAFSTLFAEGQRRYMESLSTYARQFLEKQEKPEVDMIEGLQPTIAIEQKNHTKNSRSTVGTATEVYDYLRLLFAKLGQMRDPETGELVRKNLVKDVVADHMERHAGLRAYVLFPYDFAAKTKIGDRKRSLAYLMERGFTRVLPDKNLKTDTEPEVLDLQEAIVAKASPVLGRANQALRLYVATDRVSLSEDSRGRFEDALVAAYGEGMGRALICVLGEDGKVTELARYTDFPSTGAGEKRYPELTPLLFSFNSPMGACETCKGFGNILRVDPTLVIPNPSLSVAQGAVEPFSKPSGREWLKELAVFCKAKGVAINMPWRELRQQDRDLLWKGDGKYSGIEGVFNELEDERYKKTVRIFLSRYRSPQECEVCKGARLRVEARSVTFKGKAIGDLTKLSVADLCDWFKTLKLSPAEKETAKEIVHQVCARLEFLLRVGLDYLTMSRLARTLSGGEAQRIALANQLGTRLTQTCYVLDEPSIGLHPRDTERLIGILKDLAALKNTVVVVEHDPDVIKSSDYLIDLGPAAGDDGGYLIYQGDFAEFMKQAPAESATAPYVQGKAGIPVPMRRRMDRFGDRARKVNWLEITGMRGNNLKDVTLKVPHGMFTCVTGVSGSGKSTAVRKTLFPALARIVHQELEEVEPFQKITGFEPFQAVLMIDQEPIGRSPRSNPITFMKGFDSVRELFASTQEARRQGLHAGHFSFNVPGGRCETCEGEGYIRVEMVFMEDMFLKCDICEGKRYKKNVLGVQYNGKGIHDVLAMTAAEAKKFFTGDRRLQTIFGTLEKVGLGYVRLGQASNTLSGGESQRLKIARELMRNDGAAALYILDEPTTGLHFRDIGVLLRALNELVERGNTVLVIEHNLDVMKFADWIVDFGPEGGEAGGKIVAQGAPEHIVKGKGHTARHLKPVLEAAVALGVNELEAGL